MSVPGPRRTAMARTAEPRAPAGAGDTATRPLKRSFTIAGHRTSVSLESAFWEALKDVAATEGVTLAALVARIDRQRTGCGLSTAIRVHLLQHYRGRPASRETEAAGLAGGGTGAG